MYSAKTPLWIFLVAGTLRLLPAIIALWLGAKFIDRRRMKDYGLHLNKNWWIDLVFGMGLGTFLISLIFVIELGLGWVSISGTAHVHNSHNPFIVPFLVFFLYIICQAAFEELLARGYLFRNFAEGLNFKKIGVRRAAWLSWIVISLLFGLAHLGNPDATVISTLNLIMIGLTLGAGVLLTGELAIPIGLHLSWNFAQGNIFGFPVSGLSYPSEIASLVRIEQNGPKLWTGGKFGPEAGLLGIAANLIGLLLIILWTRSEKKETACCGDRTEILTGSNHEEK
ncbi:MAG: CPBP family intramembrane metalloprotease [Deltaproteobacteria bacterium]|nr:CPBP family intramembrane metalloprotease [Deltaproteobacteria bacterium]